MFIYKKYINYWGLFTERVDLLWNIIRNNRSSSLWPYDCTENEHFPFKVVTSGYRWPCWGRVNSTQPLWAGVLPVAPSGSISEGSAATVDRQTSPWIRRRKRSWNSFPRHRLIHCNPPFFVCRSSSLQSVPHEVFFFVCVWWQTGGKCFLIIKRCVLFPFQWLTAHGFHRRSWGHWRIVESTGGSTATPASLHNGGIYRRNRDGRGAARRGGPSPGERLRVPRNHVAGAADTHRRLSSAISRGIWEVPETADRADMDPGVIHWIQPVLW